MFSSVDNVGLRLLLDARQSSTRKLWSVRNMDLKLIDFSRECAMAGAGGTGPFKDWKNGWQPGVTPDSQRSCLGECADEGGAWHYG